MENLITLPILSQEELATEAAVNDPTIYPRYVNRCITGAARPFVVIDDRTGRTRTLCTLRRRRGRWRLSTPTNMDETDQTIRLLQEFAGKYAKLAGEGQPGVHRSWRRPPGSDAGPGPEPGPEAKPGPRPGPEEGETRTASPCQRCGETEDPDQTGPGNTRGLCGRCRAEYQAKAGPQLEPQPGPGRKARPCASCRTQPGQVAVADSQKIFRICRTCELVSREYTIYEYPGDRPLMLIACRECGANLGNTYNETCPRCSNNTRVIINHLHGLLDARTNGGDENPGEKKTPDEVANAARRDMTQPREDAGPGRLDPALSVELCREYVHQGRCLPELALRFNVSLDVVRKTLRGESWAKYTQGHRPTELRREPARDRRRPAEEQPKPAYITVSRLKDEFGWNDRLAAAYLKGHDREAPNPHYRTAAPMRLYLLDRVQAVTAAHPSLQAELQTALGRRERLGQTQQARTLARRAELLAQAEKLKPEMR